MLSLFTENTTSVLEKIDCGIDAEIIDDLTNLYSHYECRGAKTPYYLIKIGGRKRRSYEFFQYP